MGVQAEQRLLLGGGELVRTLDVSVDGNNREYM